MKKNITIIIVLILILICILIGIFLIYKNENKKPKKKEKPITPIETIEGDYNLNIIKTVNANAEGNYLISPYSIEVALNMLKDGSDNNTKEEIEKAVPPRTINDISIKNRIGIANATFIKDKYKDYVESTFTNNLKNIYNAELIYDQFKNPDKINNWVSNKTNGMIDKVLDEIDESFVLGIANAIAIDVDWHSEFECVNTQSKEFTKLDNSKINVEMMINSFKGYAEYFETDNAKGVILPYKKYNKDGEITSGEGDQLEFIGILPNSNTKDYINNLTNEELQNIDNNKKTASYSERISVWLPRFKYDYEIKKLDNFLKNIGIKDVFDGNRADLTKIISKDNMEKANIDNLYVSQAIHKTHIDLNETGTKAAAVTYFGIDETTAIMEEEPKYIDIHFTKTFAYIIRDKKSKEILFFGLVDEPNKWNGPTCEEYVD